MNCCTYNFIILTLSILMLQYCDLVQSFSDENIASSVSRECKKLTECELYTNLLELQKRKVIRIGQELITEELKNQDCGWEDDMEPKGSIYSPCFNLFRDLIMKSLILIIL